MEQTTDRKVKVSKEPNGNRLKYKITRADNHRTQRKTEQNNQQWSGQSALNYAYEHPIKVALFGVAGFYLVQKYGVKQLIKLGMTAVATSLVAKATDVIDLNT